MSRPLTTAAHDGAMHQPIVSDLRDTAPGHRMHVCRGCPRPLCHAGYCTPHCRSAHARRERNREYHKYYDAARRQAAKGAP